MKRYNPKVIEPKWQAVWEKSKIYQASEDKSKPKRYVLEYFPYPSGAAMHVGHVRNYTIGDAVARYGRMSGMNVLHPMGWDAFGLPAENYAIKSGISPQEAVAKNIANFKQQLMQMGFSYDWLREINSTDPGYYKWTQWFFLLLFKRGLAYQKNSLQWWCPVDKTVLANEQVEEGRCWRCGHLVEKKALKQWFFKITDYADRLAGDLEKLDWSEAIKSMQRNWIGKSQGALVEFKISNLKFKIDVFTTRPDTIFGATFLVVAPEHPILNKLSISKEVKEYIKRAERESEIERMETDREKTGVFIGYYATNPANKQKIPIWVADYVLPGYGTGAIMAVPAHDQRDWEFAQKFNLEVISVIEPTEARYLVIEKSLPDKVVPELKNFGNVVVEKKDGKWGKFFRVSVPQDKEKAFREFLSKNLLEKNQFDKGTWYVDSMGSSNYVIYKSKITEVISSSGYQEFKDYGLKLSIPTNQLDIVFDGSIVYTGEGVLKDSDKYNGMPTSEAREKIVNDLTEVKEKTNYKIRDWLISRQRYWGAPIPIVHCPKDGAVAVPDKDLPVILPKMDSYEPSGDGHSPLARVPEFVNTICPKCGGQAKRETDTMDGFACSSWYFLRFADPHNDKKPFDSKLVKQWLPVDDYIGGAEHAVMHLLYARFWTKVMFDEGLIDFDEPFTKLRNHGMILAPDGRKMSKSWNNTIEPDNLIKQGYGADAIRVLELFIGPWDQSAAWSVEGLGGTYRFLQRIWTIVQEFLDETKDQRSKIKVQSTGSNSELEVQIARTVHKAIKKVTQDMQTLSFNTAIAALMECVNELYKIKGKHPSTKLGASNFGLAHDTWKENLEKLIQLLAPFAPHIAEELWAELDHESSVHISSWPAWDEKLIKEELITLAVQINGKVRSEILVAADVTQKAAIEAAKLDEKIANALSGKKVKREIYVPGRIVNLVI